MSFYFHSILILHIKEYTAELIIIVILKSIVLFLKTALKIFHAYLNFRMCLTFTLSQHYLSEKKRN